MAGRRCRRGTWRTACRCGAGRGRRSRRRGALLLCVSGRSRRVTVTCVDTHSAQPAEKTSQKTGRVHAALGWLRPPGFSPSAVAEEEGVSACRTSLRVWARLRDRARGEEGRGNARCNPRAHGGANGPTPTKATPAADRPASPPAPSGRSPWTRCRPAAARRGIRLAIRSRTPQRLPSEGSRTRVTRLPSESSGRPRPGRSPPSPVAGPGVGCADDVAAPTAAGLPALPALLRDGLQRRELSHFFGWHPVGLWLVS